MAPKLPIEIILTICKDAAQPTFSQREKYDMKNPYSTALSLCLVSRLVRRIILPDFLRTILLRRRHSLKKFANALLMQKAYAEKKSDLFFDYTSAVQRMWISDAFDYFVYAEAQTVYAWSEDEEARSEDEEARSEDEDSHYFWGTRKFSSKKDEERARNISVSLPVILAAPELAVDYGHLKHIILNVQDGWSSRTDLNVGGHSSFPEKIKNLTIIRQALLTELFYNTVETFDFLASIPHLTHLIDLAEYSHIYRGISCGTDSPKFPVYLWMRDNMWNSMKSLETFSVVYPHLPPIHDFKSITYAAYATRGIDLHVERFTVSAALYKQDPDSFSWGPPWFPVTDPGNKRIQSNGISFEVTRDKVYFSQYFCSWDEAWACGLTDG